MHARSFAVDHVIVVAWMWVDVFCDGCGVVVVFVIGLVIVYSEEFDWLIDFSFFFFFFLTAVIFLIILVAAVELLLFLVTFWLSHPLLVLFGAVFWVVTVLTLFLCLFWYVSLCMHVRKGVCKWICMRMCMRLCGLCGRMWGRVSSDCVCLLYVCLKK